MSAAPPEPGAPAAGQAMPAIAPTLLSPAPAAPLQAPELGPDWKVQFEVNVLSRQGVVYRLANEFRLPDPMNPSLVASSSGRFETMLDQLLGEPLKLIMRSFFPSSAPAAKPGAPADWPPSPAGQGNTRRPGIQASFAGPGEIDPPYGLK